MTYETKLGTVTITSGRVMIKGQWGVMGRINGRELFVGFAGKPELEAQFPSPEWMNEENEVPVPQGWVVKNGRMFRVDEMDSENCIK